MHDADTYEVNPEFNFEYWPFAIDSDWRRFVPDKQGSSFVTVRDLQSGEDLQQWSLRTLDMKLLYDEGRRLAVTTSDREIVVLDVESGAELGRLRGHTEKISSLAILPGHDRLVSGSDDRTIRLWDLQTMEEVSDLRGHADTVWALAVTRDGQTIFSGSGDFTIRRWDTRPVSELLAARQVYKAAAARLEPMIVALFKEQGDATRVADHVEADSTLSERERQIALQIVLKTSIARMAP